MQDITLGGPAEIELFSPAGQIVVKRVALQFGFQKSSDDQRFIKTAIGAPITPDGLSQITERLRLSYGTRSIANLPNRFEGFDQQRRQGSAELTSKEDILSPCLIITNDRKVCIQPIGASYADQLLGTSKQSSFLPQFEGAFRARKTYVSSGRSKNLFQPDQIILFYESSRTGGRGAVVAAAKVDDVVSTLKQDAGRTELKRTVVDRVDRFSASEQVTLVRFSSILRFPRPVSLDELRQLKATGTQNLQTTTHIATRAAQEVFDLGWSYG